MLTFEAFPKIPRLRRAILITEKLDGTNAAVVIDEDGNVGAQSRNRLITPESDNYGFARWVQQNEYALARDLGPGRHFGEWWGVGIQRGYDLRERRFSLFNTKRWYGNLTTDLVEAGVSTVPVVGSGPMDDATIGSALERLRTNGSVAAPGFMRPEGVVVFHLQSQSMFKVLLENDETPKSVVEAKVTEPAGVVALNGLPPYGSASQMVGQSGELLPPQYVKDPAEIDLTPFATQPLEFC